MTDEEIKLKYGPEFRRCVLELDVEGMRKLWKHCAPHLAQSSPSGTLYALHLARTEMETCPISLKLYSQAWLNERGLGSGMMGDKRQRTYGVIK